MTPMNLPNLYGTPTKSQQQFKNMVHSVLICPSFTRLIKRSEMNMSLVHSFLAAQMTQGREEVGPPRFQHRSDRQLHGEISHDILMTE